MTPLLLFSPQAFLILQVSYTPPPGAAPLFPPASPPEPSPGAAEPDTVTGNESAPRAARGDASPTAHPKPPQQPPCPLPRAEAPTEEEEAEDRAATGDETEPAPSGPPGSEPPSLPRKPPVHHVHGVRRRRSSPKKPLSNKPQDFQVRRGQVWVHPSWGICVLVHPSWGIRVLVHPLGGPSWGSRVLVRPPWGTRAVPGAHPGCPLSSSLSPPPAADPGAGDRGPAAARG